MKNILILLFILPCICVAQGKDTVILNPTAQNNKFITSYSSISNSVNDSINVKVTSTNYRGLLAQSQLKTNLDLSGTNSGDNSANSTYSSDYRAANFIAGTNYLAPAGNGSALTGLTSSQVSLGNVTNTSDANKPVSTAQQTALDLKANLINPSFITPALGSATGVNLSLTGSAKWNTFQVNIPTTNAPATGATISAATTQWNVINPAATIATLTVTLPTSPVDGQEVDYSFVKAVTTLTFTGGTLQTPVTSATADSFIRLGYVSSLSKWVRK